MPKIKKAEITLDYQEYIFTPPIAPKQLWDRAASSDDVTINKMGPLWVENVKANHKTHGPFKDRSVAKLFNSEHLKPVICVGSGPSLKRNGEELKDRKGIKAISCLHNFHFFEDRDIAIDYYLSLDAQDVVVEEVTEGGANPPEWYWERTKGKTLIAYIGSPPKLLAKWQGEILFFNCPVPHESVDPIVDGVEVMHHYVAPGGNALGACVYVAKAILGCNPVVFMGADFSFSYDKKFHGWDSKYDKNIGQVMRAVDVFGNKVLTWGSYWGFKCYFDYVAQSVPGLYINCTEGGILGAYPEGNLICIQQMDLCDFYNMYNLNDLIKDVFDSVSGTKKVLY